MLTPEHIVVGLDVGTSKICAAVGERLKSGEVSIIGIGESASRGIRKGEVVEREAAEGCIREAIAQAEEVCGVEIRSVVVSVSGSHVRSFNNRGEIPVTGENHEITGADIDAVIRHAKAINFSVANEPLHVLRQHFYVDGHDGVLDPLGLHGAKLAADVHVIHGIRTRLQNTIGSVRAVGVDVTDAVFGGLASALGTLTPHEKEIGSIVIDIGGGTTEYVVYVRDSVEHSGVLAVGGDHLTNDVATGLKIPMRVAEKLKRTQGSVLPDDIAKKQIVPILDEDSFVGRREVPRHTLCQILQLRAEELLSLVKQDIQRHCSLDYIGAGIFLAGGTAHLNGIQRQAADVFGLPVHLGRGKEIGGVVSALQNPEYATAIGLVKFGIHTRPAPRATTRLTAISHRLSSFFARARNVF